MLLVCWVKSNRAWNRKVEIAVKFSCVEEEMLEVTRTTAEPQESSPLKVSFSEDVSASFHHFSCFHRPKSFRDFSPKLVSFLMWSQRWRYSQRSAITHLAGVNAQRSTPTVTRQDGPARTHSAVSVHFISVIIAMISGPSVRTRLPAALTHFSENTTCW